MKHNRLYCKAILFLLFSMLQSTSIMADECDEVWTVNRAIDREWTSYNIADVRLASGTYFKKMQDIHRNYLLSLNPERLLNNVMRAADMETSAENYGGWQHNSGNGFGNYMSGCSMMYAATGYSLLRKRVEWMVDVIAECQEKENLGGWFHFSRTKGFYNQLMNATGEGCYPQNNGEDFYSNTDMVGWEFYQIHRIFSGLRDAYYYAGIEKAKDVFIKCMEWACTWTEKIKSDADFQMALEAEHGGMLELFMDAYALTGDSRFLRNGKRWIQSLNLRDKAVQGVDVLPSRHANVYDPKFIGLIREYEMTGDEENGKAAQFIWKQVVDNHIFPMGGHGRWERYCQPGRRLDALANTSSETCCTYNMLKFTKAMFSIYGDANYMDFYERALYNHILATKDPDNTSVGGGFCYVQSLLPGMYRKYMDDWSFYCCWETSLENHAKLGEAIYFHHDDNILVNLYIPSTLTDNSHGLKLTMKGNWPQYEDITLTVNANDSFSGDIFFRIPGWMSKDDVTIERNGTQEPLTDRGKGMVSISGPWATGDVLTLHLPATLRYEPSEEPDIASVFFGPILLCPDMGSVTNDYTGNMWEQTAPSEPMDFPTINCDKDNLAEWFKRRGITLRFIPKETGKYEYLPFYEAHHIKTSIYQRFTSEKDKEAARRLVPDRINIGFDDSHRYIGESSTGSLYNRYYIRVNKDKSIQYDMKLSPESDMQHYVMLQYNGWENTDMGNYSVYIDDVLVGKGGPCDYAQQFSFPHAFHKIPASLTKGKSEVTLKLQQGDRDMCYYGIALVTERYLQEMCPESKHLYDTEPTIQRWEAESAQPHGDNRTFDGKSSGGAYVKSLSTYLQYNNIYIPRNGDYELRICQRGAGAFSYNITIGNNSITTTLPPSGGAWRIVSVPVSLEQGFCTFNIAPTTPLKAKDIDYIELAPKGADGISRNTPDDESNDWGAKGKTFVVSSAGQNHTMTFSPSIKAKGIIGIYNTLGQLYTTLRYPEQQSLDTTKLPDGIYVARFINNIPATHF